MEFTVTPLTPEIGAEFRGLDLRQPLDDETMGGVRQVWLDHVIVLFPEQEIDDDQQIAFSRRIGELELINMVLDGRSKAIFGGTVLVRKDSQKVTARQTDKNLLLSEYAEVDSKPSLLIYADDVQCGHGATAGHLDPDALFYLRSRGLDAETANRFLVHAFVREIMDTVTVGPLQDFLDQTFSENLFAALNQPGSAP